MKNVALAPELPHLEISTALGSSQQLAASGLICASLGAGDRCLCLAGSEAWLPTALAWRTALAKVLS